MKMEELNSKLKAPALANLFKKQKKSIKKPHFRLFYAKFSSKIESKAWKF